MKKKFDINDFPEWDMDAIRNSNHLENMVKHLPDKLIELGYQKNRGKEEFLNFTFDALQALTSKVIKQKGFDPEMKIDAMGTPFFKRLSQ